MHVALTLTLLSSLAACSFPRPERLAEDAAPSDGPAPEPTSDAATPDAGPMDFVVTLAAPRVHVVQGSSAEMRIVLSRNAFTDPVNITVEGLPAGITVDALVISGDEGNLTFHASEDATQGESEMTITAAGGTRSHEARISMLSMGLPGTLDKTFARSVANMPRQTNSRHCTSMLVQPNGNIVIAGLINDSAGADGAFVARYLANGEIDPSFAGGVVTVLDASRTTDTDRAVVVQQPDGKLVLTWSTGFAPIHGQVVRLTSQGLLDQQFGSGGKVLLDLNEIGTATATTLNAAAIQPDGGILVAGSTHIMQGGTDTIAAVVARLSPTGLLDNSFGTMGRVTTTLGVAGADFYGLLLQPDGRIFAAGGSRASGRKQIAAFARFDHEGRLDRSFDNDGFLTMDIGSPSTTTDDFLGTVSIARQTDGKLVIAGGASTTASANNPALIRLNESDGSPDASFGTMGVKILSLDLLGNMDGQAGPGFVLQGDEKLLLAGSALVSGHQVNFVARLKKSTDLDFEFGSGQGLATTPVPTIGTGEEGGGYTAIALDADGRITVAGYYTTARGSDQIILDRFWP